MKNPESGIEGNLPSWPGASAVYSKAYKLLSRMAETPGHVTVGYFCGRRTCYPSETMSELIEALDEGREERIKGLMLQTWRHPK